MAMAKRKRKPDSSLGEKGNAGKELKDKESKKTHRKEDGDGGKVSSQSWSKSKKKRMRMLKAKLKRKDGVNSAQENPGKGEQKYSPPDGTSSPEKKPPDRKSGKTLREKFLSQLSGSRFRMLNEELYTTTSGTAFNRFTKNPELYEQYHEGFRYQVEQWPVNPIDVLVKLVKGEKEQKFGGRSDKVVVADFGCGDAELAEQLLQVKQNGQCPFLIHSFDLVAKSEHVTACDMSNVPLPPLSVDIGIFCLSLMGTNLADFVREAYRVLKAESRLIIAEVRSRFESKSGKNELNDFIEVLAKLGFDCTRKDQSNKMFVILELEKSTRRPSKDLDFTAKPCLYKRR